MKSLRFALVRRPVWLALAVLALVIVPGLAPLQAQPDHDPPVPLPGLTSAEQARFAEGEQLFVHPFTPQEGLGPIFNGRTCEACHHTPTVGGNGPGYRSNIRFIDNPPDRAAKLFHDKSIAGGPAESLPDNGILSKRRPPHLGGDGLIEAIPQDAILANADPNDADGDGIRGRAAMRDGQVLRFGSQAHVGNLLEFVASALFLEIGLTSPFPGFNVEPGNPSLSALLQSRVPQPNVTMANLRKLVDFIAMLAPPAQDTANIGSEPVLRGERLFRDLACAKCHVPLFHTTAAPFTRPGDTVPVDIAALLNKDLAPYSDFLLHDMGSTLDDGVALGVAKPNEYRTPPLWGVRFHQHLLLHDGRANSLEQAIVYHGGEAARSRQRFLALPAADRQALVDFLKTL